MVYMRVTLPLLRIQPARASILRYGVAVLSTTLALIPVLLLPNIAESRLAVFAVAVMVSAWYGGWKPGLVATSFALTVSAYFSFSGEHTPAQYRSTMIRLTLFVVLAAADLLVQRSPASVPGRFAALRNEFPLAGDQRSLRNLPLRFRGPTAGCESRAARDAGIFLNQGTGRETPRSTLRRHAAVVRTGGLLALGDPLQRADRRVEAQGRHGHGGSRFRSCSFRRRQRTNLRAVCRRCDRAPRPRAATPAVAEDGSGRKTRGRHCARFQQPADGDFRLFGISARPPRPGPRAARPGPGDCQRSGTSHLAHPPAPRLQPQANAGAEDS